MIYPWSDYLLGFLFVIKNIPLSLKSMKFCQMQYCDMLFVRRYVNPYPANTESN